MKKNNKKVKTKIIATLGPASNTERVLRKMFIKGLDIVRLNFSHGSKQEHLLRIRIVHSLNKKMRRAIKIMQDLEGCRIRVGKLKQPVYVRKNEKIFLSQCVASETKNNIPFDYTGSLDCIKKGAIVYIDDGKISLLVEKINKTNLQTKVLNPGLIKQNKGINIPDAELDFPVITDKDREDVKVAIDEKLDYVAQSFVGTAKEVKSLRKILEQNRSGCKIFAKIENKKAIKNIDTIIDAADGIIVARGDLGICVPIYKVPLFQKEIIRKCNIKKKPVVVATQMLESMTESPLPTRAEVSDVANAILDGASHLLLSGETAVGNNPAAVIDMMNRIIKYTETYSSGPRKVL